MIEILNNIVLIGRLTKDPELRFTQGKGTAICKFTLAVDRPFKRDGEKETDFIDITVWGSQAESSGTYLAKGKLACVNGRLQITNKQKEDGGWNRFTEVVAERVIFLSPKEAESMGEEMSFTDDDIPF